MFRIKELRLAKNISMRQVALSLNIPYTTYVSYEKGEREPNSEMLIKLSDYYECTIDYLIGRSENKQSVYEEPPIPEIPQNTISDEEKAIVDDIRSLTEEQRGVIGYQIKVFKEYNEMNPPK